MCNVESEFKYEMLSQNLSEKIEEWRDEKNEMTARKDQISRTNKQSKLIKEKKMLASDLPSATLNARRQNEEVSIKF